MSEIVHIKKSYIVGISVLVLMFVASLVLGYSLLKDGQQEENCWDKYTTEEQAILNCEQ